MTNVVKVDSLLRNRSVLPVVGLFEDGRSELLLALTERIHVGRTHIDRLGPTCLGLPVGGGAKSVLLRFTVILDRGVVLVTTTKDARL